MTFVNAHRISNLSKLILSRRLIKRYPVKPSYYPATLAVEITTKCNLKCLRCEREAVPESVLGHDMNIETFKKVYPIFRYVKSVSLVGLGEPFLNPDFWHMHALVKNSGAQVAYFTNGLLMTPENIERTFREKTDFLFLDLDSLKPERYNKIKRGADLEKTVELIREIVYQKKKSGLRYPKLYVNCAIQSNTLDEVLDIIDFAAREGIDKIWFTGVMSHIPQSIPLSLFSISPEKIREVFNQAKKKALRLKVKIRLPELRSFNKKSVCEEPWTVMHIFYNGDVCACCHFRNPKKYYFYVEDGKLRKGSINYPDLIMGNINEESVLDIWNNNKYIFLRNQIVTGKHILPCRYCYYAYGWH